MPDLKCPEHGVDLMERKGKSGKFWGCPCYPDCRYTMSEGNGARERIVVKRSSNTAQMFAAVIERLVKFEPLEKVISIEDLQKIMDTAEEVVNKLKGEKYGKTK